MIRKKFQQLICPIDGAPLLYSEQQLSCNAGHCFDVAKQGYVNLLPVQKKKSLAPGDSKEMVDARARFLDSGVYQTVFDKLQSLIESFKLPDNARIMDAGCGDGYYTKQLAQKFTQFQFIGLDISKQALKAASRKSNGIDRGIECGIDWSIDWIVASNSQPPLAPESIDLIICIFGFHSFAGFSKVLKPKGKIILVDPAEEHLIELREQIYERVKKRPAYSIDDATQHHFLLTDQNSVNFTTQNLQPEQINDLLLMTPHLFRASAEGKAKVKGLKELRVTIDMSFRVLQFLGNGAISNKG